MPAPRRSSSRKAFNASADLPCTAQLGTATTDLVTDLVIIPDDTSAAVGFTVDDLA
jgi:hypothetical protein